MKSGFRPLPPGEAERVPVSSGGKGTPIVAETADVIVFCRPACPYIGYRHWTA
ncbi:MAG: hypothetical protein ACLSTO_04690 [Bilophila wadsworthia]